MKILDFGLAQAPTGRARRPIQSTAVTRETDAGHVIGTAGYMAPEQVPGRLDHRATFRARLRALRDAHRPARIPRGIVH